MTVRIPVNRSFNWVLRWASRALISLGCAGLGIYFWSEIDARIYQESQSLDYAEAADPPDVAPELIRDPLQLRAPGKGAEQSSPRLPWTRDPRLIGRLEIPRIGLAVLIREGIEPQTLRRAVGHMPDTAMPGAPGNFVVAGHRDTFFRKLRLVQRGDEIRVTTPGRSVQYRVVELLVVDPDAVDAIQPTAQPSCTLITCFPFDVIGSAPRRMLVRGLQTGTNSSNPQWRAARN